MSSDTEHNASVSHVVAIDEESECQIELALEGMSCASCAMRIEKGLKKVHGVKDASVNFATEKALVIYDRAQTDVEQMQQKVEQIGYKATPVMSPQLVAPDTDASP